MSSAAIIILSSSPPPAFARSPTPAELPSPTRSPSTPIRDGAKRFKTSTNVRDRFSSAFSSARALATKSGAENVPLHTQATSKFKPPSSIRAERDIPGPSLAPKFLKRKPKPPADRKSDPAKPSKPDAQLPVSRPEAAHDMWSLEYDDQNGEPSLPDGEGSEHHERFSSPKPMEKAVPRRMDWTPVKQDINSMDTPESQKQGVGLMDRLFDSYAFDESSTGMAEKMPVNLDAAGEQSNIKRRIDLVMVTETNSGSLTSKPKSVKEVKGVGRAKSRTKGPAKKALTITGLSTSAYNDEHQKKGRLPLMLESLTSSQAAAETQAESVIDAGLKGFTKAKSSTRKARATKKPAIKSRLLSPTSAIKGTEAQLFMFGSASQLARDESPALIRDTMEALKRSDGLFSDAISPQRTQPFSIESTSPRVMHGTSRLVRRRDLWSVAGRDANNALLQVETVDMTDSPAVRGAYAGEDALLQLCGPEQQDEEHLFEGWSSTKTPCNKTAASLFDINDIVTPSPILVTTAGHTLVRAMHTSRTLGESATEEERQPEHVDVLQVTVAPVKPKAVMPSYAGWSDHELKKQIAAFKFKPVRKREKMIELLQRCWKSQNGIEDESDGGDAATAAPTHGSVLDKVHDLSTRPTPKVKKPKTKRKSDATDPGTPKEPKKRKTAAKKTGEDAKKEKAPRKRATKKKVLSDEKITDVDDIDRTTTDQAAPKCDSLPNKSGLPGKADKSQVQRPTTPPATIPPEDFSWSSPAFEDQRPNTKLISVPDIRQTEGSVPTPEHTPAPDILGQIYAAIHHRSDIDTADERNHQVSPTWQEKILMYDPIVLEELTVWLNTEGFRAIGEDREVDPLQVRDWCEQNGLCCLGVGGGWRGKGKRVDGE